MYRSNDRAETAKGLYLKNRGPLTWSEVMFVLATRPNANSRAFVLMDLGRYLDIYPPVWHQFLDFLSVFPGGERKDVCSIIFTAMRMRMSCAVLALYTVPVALVVELLSLIPPLDRAKVLKEFPRVTMEDELGRRVVELEYREAKDSLNVVFASPSDDEDSDDLPPLMPGDQYESFDSPSDDDDLPPPMPRDPYESAEQPVASAPPLHQVAWQPAVQAPLRQLPPAREAAPAPPRQLAPEQEAAPAPPQQHAAQPAARAATPPCQLPPEQEAAPEQDKQGLLSGYDRLPADTVADDSASHCVICLDHVVRVALIPCGHLCLCIGCTHKFSNRQCPMCCKDATGALITFS